MDFSEFANAEAHVEFGTSATDESSICTACAMAPSMQKRGSDGNYRNSHKDETDKPWPSVTRVDMELHPMEWFFATKVMPSQPSSIFRCCKIAHTRHDLE